MSETKDDETLDEKNEIDTTTSTINEESNNNNTEQITTSSSSTPLSKKELKKQEKEKQKEDKEKAKEDKEKAKEDKEKQKQKEKEEKERAREEKEKLKLKEKEDKEKLKEDKKSNKLLSPKLASKVQKSFSQENLMGIVRTNSSGNITPNDSKPSTPIPTEVKDSLSLENSTTDSTNSNSTTPEIDETPVQTLENIPPNEPLQKQIETQPPQSPQPQSQPPPINKANSNKDVFITVTRAFAPIVHQNILGEEGENKMRNKVINEVINTEKDYISDLNVIINFIYQPLKESKLISDKDLSIIFSNIQLLVGVNKELLKDLEKAANETQGSSIGPCFKFFSEYLKIYSSYCANQQTSADHIQYCSKKNPQFKQFLDEKQQSTECRQFPLDSFLIKPIQRLCKYPLLLRELIKNSKEGHPDSVSLEEAYVKIQTVVSTVNESKRKAEVQQKMFQIHEQLESTEKFDFLTPTRYLIREDTLRELTEEKDKVSGKMHYYLFNDIIMRTKKDKKSIKLETLFLIASTKVNSEENRLSTFCNTFELCQLGSAGRKFTLVCDSYEQKMEWITDIENLIRPHEEQSMREYEKLLDETFLAKRSTIATTTPSSHPDSPKQLARSVTASTIQLSKPLPPPPPKPSPNSNNNTNNININNNNSNLVKKPNDSDNSTIKKRPVSVVPVNNTSSSNINLSSIPSSNNNTPDIPIIARPKPVGNRRITSSIISPNSKEDTDTNNNNNNNNNGPKQLNRTSLQITSNNPSPITNEPTKYQFQPISKSNSNSNLNVQSPDSTTEPTPPVSKPSGRPLPKPTPSVSKPVTSPVSSPTNITPQEKLIPERGTLQKFPSMASLKLASNTSKSVSTFTPSKSRELLEQHQQLPQTKDDMDLTLNKTNTQTPPKNILNNRVMPLPPTTTTTTTTTASTSLDSPNKQPKPLPSIPPVVPPVLPKRNSIVPK